ncbi:MAG: S9 family peptidase [Colwellia sp.]|nr:S9 family peptidase [Colwellia sp.]
MKSMKCLLLFFTMSLLSFNSLATDKKLPSASDFFSLPDYTTMNLSPSGKYIATLMPINNRLNIVVIETKNRKNISVLTGFKEYNVGSYFWSSDDRIVFNVDQSDGQEAFSLYSVTREKKPKITELVKATFFNRRSIMASIVHTLPDDPDHIIVQYNKRYVKKPDLYKMRVDTKWNHRRQKNSSMELIAKNPGDVQNWIVDHDGEVRGAVSIKGLTGKFLYKGKGKKDFKVIREFNILDEGITPLMFDYDNKSMYVSSNIGRDRAAVYKYDPETDTLGDMLFGHDKVDVSNLITSRKRQKLLGVSYIDDYPEQAYFDQAEANFHQTLKNSFKGKTVGTSSINKDETLRIIFTYSDTDPGSYYLWDDVEKRISKLGNRVSTVNNDILSPMKPFEITSRDGLTLRGYITIPKSTDGKKIPLIINPHGGPFGIRDGWGYNPDTQFLASRGYAVVQVNYRGSGGYGRKFEHAGYGGKWGHEMQNDITDTVNHFIETGVADASRVCIYGGSYGGYATMAGLTFTPELYKCGVNVVGVTDVGLLFTSMQETWEPMKEVMKVQIGDPDDEKLMKSMSPIDHVEKIQAPVFIIHGRKDVRVVMEHADMLRDRLEDLDKPYEWLVKDKEGHGFRKVENRIEMYEKLEKFFAKNL